MKFAITIATIGLGSMLAFPPLAAGANKSCAVNAAELYYPCASCHGDRAEGSEPFAAPALAGLDANYVRTQLENFRANIRGAQPLDSAGQAMTLLAKTLRDSPSVDAVACYIAALPPVTRPRPTLRGRVQRGRSLYAACAACHGAAGEGNALLQAPSLRPLADWYIRRQLELFRSGQRGADPNDALGQQMRAAVAVLTHPNDAADLAAYIVRLK